MEQDYTCGVACTHSIGYNRVVASGHSSMVELQPSKLAVRVRFPLPAPVYTCVPPLRYHHANFVLLPLVEAVRVFPSQAATALCTAARLICSTISMFVLGAISW